MKNQNNLLTAGSFERDDPVRIEVSALVDGELDEATIERTIDALLASDDLANFWADAHRSGDWMRSEEVVGIGDGQLFLRRFSAQLESEPPIVAPKARARIRTRRFWVNTGLPSASIAAALVVVAWVAMPLGRNAEVQGGRPTIAIVPASTNGVVVASDLKPIDPERLSDYLQAHRDGQPFAFPNRGPSAKVASFTTIPVVEDDRTKSR